MSNRGSEYRKWDMHIHSPYTMVNNQFGLSDGKGKIFEDKFIQKIIESNISAVGLTNYFNFTEEDFRLKNKLNNIGIATFLNLEVRLSYINKHDQLFDYHIIFDNELEDVTIKNILAQLKANIGSTDKSFNTLTNSEIENVANIDFSTLMNVLNYDNDLGGRFLTGFLARGHGSATSDSDPKNMAVYENICVKSDFLIHSSCDDPATCKDKKCAHNNIMNDREYWLNHSPYVRPLLQSSDAHSLEEIGTKYSWVKADLTFEGLKQIKYEPEYRICVKKDKPILEKDELVIDSVHYKNCNIYLSENLNAIIGGRSTGKSTLLNSIAKKLGHELSTKAYSFENLDDFQIIWKDQQEENSRRIEYIPQEHMYTLAREREKLKDLVGSIIQSKDMDLELKKYEQNCNNLRIEIIELLENYKENQNSISELVKPEAEEQATKNRIENYEANIKILMNDSKISEMEGKLFETQNRELQELKNKRAIYESDLKYLSSIPPITFEIKSYDNTLSPSPDLRIEIGKLNARLQDTFRKQQEYEIGRIKLNKEDQIRINENKINSIENDSTYKRCIEATKNNSEIARLNSLIKGEYDNLSRIEKFKNRKNELDKENIDIKNKIISKYKVYSKYREDLLSSFKIEDDDSLKISIEFNLKDLELEFDYISARGRSKQDFIDKLTNSFDEVIDSIFEDDNLTFNGNRNKLNHIEHFFTTNFYDYQFEIEYQGDKFDQMSPGKKAFIVLKLILEFSDSKIPVLIDQPEDSLDNRAIYNQLTQYIKQTKLKRQIIIVTHNPNIVVAGDAENIIVANQQSDDFPNQNGEKFDYINGALENNKNNLESQFILQKQSIRTHVCDILEGGEDAFINRENKYSFNH
ncbi:TrlF family AAA-like ATPase [Streptococcus sp. 1001283B150225_161107_H12]|uniref:TrlF family AAA-like ATPase n=1 Tax=Streptococcus sp. 1001283B150225_161107_H12 TaxID=2787122 RepID=UPI001898077B|nr:ATPase [Streptococcus sp. 1001283B150225_161107_H12]